MDFLYILVFTLMGIFLGTITGLIPGLHTNTISLIFFFIYLNYNINAFYLSVILFSMVITHSFTSFLPSVYLNIPEESTLLSLSLSQKYAQKNLHHKAVILSLLGGISIMLFFLITFPLLLKAYPLIYTHVSPLIPYFLIIYTLCVLLTSTRRLKTLFVIGAAGLLGLTILKAQINKNYILLPLFTGLFGLSHILLTFNNPQNKKTSKTKKKYQIRTKDIISGTLNGYLSSILATLIPSLGATSSTKITQKITKLRSNDSLLISLGSITTLDALLSVLTIYLVNNAKSGTAVVIDSITTIDLNSVIIFSLIFFVNVPVSALITLKISEYLEKNNIQNTYLLNSIIISFVVVLTVLTSGFVGLITLILSTIIGIFVIKNKMDKTLMNFVLIIPTILMYITK